MKKKTLAYLLLGVMAISGCEFSKNSSSSPVTPSSTGEKTSSSVSSNVPGTNNSSSSSTSDGITHRDPFETDIENSSKTRDYKSDYDEMVEDFSTNGNQKNTLRVLVDSETMLANTPDFAIYKMATGSYELESYEGIGFRMRKVGEGTLDLSNLVLALRGGDAFETYPISLADAVDTDVEALPELTEEYQDFIIAPGQSIEDDTTEYPAKEGGNSGVKVLEEILGFHLYATGEYSQVIEIEEVFLVNAGERTTLDNFNRKAVNKVDDTCWWRDSAGVIIRNGVKLNNSKVTVNTEVGDYENIALTVLGDTTGTTIAPVTASGVGTPVAWSNLKDADGANVSNAVNGAYHSLTANFEQSGISVEGLTGFEINSTTEVYLNEVFLTNFKDKEAATEYPLVDSENASMFDNFNRTQSGFNGDYDASSTNQTVLDAGLTYALSYNNGDKVSVADGYVTFDATNLGADDYINFKEGNDNAYHGEKYLVLSVKMEDGATLDNFRFNVGNEIKYVNQMFSAPGLKVPMTFENYPYTTADGFSWLVIDLAESGMTATNFIDFYYSGTGKLMIDAAFFANEYVRFNEIETFTLAGGTDLTTYKYLGYIYGAPQAEFIRATFTSNTEGQTLKSIRFGTGNGEHWFKDGKVIDVNGNAISGDTVIPEGGLTVIIDIAASGMALGDIHVHGGEYDGSTGDITMVATTLSRKLYNEIETFTLAGGTDLITYKYLGYIYGAPQAKFIRATFTSNTEGQTLKSIRFGTGNGEHWFKDGKVIDAEGNAISGDTVIPEGGLTVIIDIEASGMALGDIHVHGGEYDGSTGDITMVATTLSQTSYADILSGLAQ